MLTYFSRVMILSAVLVLPLCVCGCETSHSETTKQNLLGGTTHEETTTYKNPDGSTSVDQQKQVTH